MSTRRLRNLGDAFRAGVDLEITCINAECGRVRRVTPGQLLPIFGATASFATIGARLRCRGAEFGDRGCGQRGALVRYLFAGPPDPDATPPGGGASNVVPFAPRRAAPTPRSTAKRRVARARRRAGKRSHFP